MKKRIEDKEKLESQIQEMSKNTVELTKLTQELNQEIQRLKNIKETMTKTYRTFIIAKFKLKPYGIVMDNIEQFVRCVVGVSKENYDPVQIIKKIGDYETLEKETKYYESEVNLKKEELAKLNQDIESQKNTLGYLKIKVDMLNDLEARGFGIKELRTLINILNEIGLENKQEFEETKKQFFEDVKNYEEVIGSRKEIERLKNERKNLEIQIIKGRENFNAYPQVIESIIRLAGAGISEEDIVKIDRILSMTNFYLHKDNTLYKKALFDDLQKYGNLKVTIKNLDIEIEKKLKDIEIDLKSTKKIQHKPTKKKPRNVYKAKRKDSVELN